MTPKQYDQFLVDYYQSYEEISVQCIWLQKQLRDLEDLKRQNTKLKTMLDIKSTLSSISQPQYHLEVYA